MAKADKAAPAAAEGTEAPATVRKIADKLFLGPEFLTWLYFTLLDEEMVLDLSDTLPADEDGSANVQFAIGKRAVLKTIDAGGARVTLSGAGLDDNGEILQAIRRGAYVDTLSLDMSLGHRVYGFTLNATDGGFSGVKLPELFSEPEDQDAMDPTALFGPPQKKKRRPKLPLEDILALRMQCLDELESVLNALFARFVTRRLARAWHTEDVAAIRLAVAKGLKARLV